MRHSRLSPRTVLDLDILFSASRQPTSLANRTRNRYTAACGEADDIARKRSSTARGSQSSRFKGTGLVVTSTPIAGGKNHDVVALPAPSLPPATVAKVAYGKILPPQQQLILYSSSEWEDFIQEWVTAIKKTEQYVKIGRPSGGGDMGVDVAGFRDDKKFQGVWDNYQCKFYADPVTVGEGLVEIGKVIWYSFNGEYLPPKKYFFVAPKGVAPSFKKLLMNGKLKAELKKRWDKSCKDKITATQTIPLDGALLTYVDNFDFTIFDFKEALEIIDGHRTSKYFATRFGGGLPARPGVPSPPPHSGPAESRYIEQLYGVYSEREQQAISDSAALGSFPALSEHLDRQREAFYHAEALRNFARDTVPSGTFENLQNEIYDGVVEVEQADHKDGLDRANAVTQSATNLQLTSNGLITVMNVKDRKGICHQLANIDKLKWKKP